MFQARLLKLLQIIIKAQYLFFWPPAQMTPSFLNNHRSFSSFKISKTRIGSKYALYICNLRSPIGMYRHDPGHYYDLPISVIIRRDVIPPIYSLTNVYRNFSCLSRQNLVRPIDHLTTQRVKSRNRQHLIWSRQRAPATNQYL